jgi:hypothetical protein
MSESPTGVLEEGRRLGRPKVHEESWSKITVVLLNRQIVFLDRLSADIRAASGAVVKRAEILRALIDALAQSDLDLTRARSEKDVRETLSLLFMAPGS